MREAVAAILALVTVACVEEGPTEPTPPSPLAGAYTFTLETSSVCRLPVSRFEWAVEATSSGTASTSGDTMATRVTLPGGDATLDLSLVVGITSLVSGTLTAREVQFGDENLRLSVGGTSRGAITADPAGRSAIVDGMYNGPISLAPPDNRDPDAVTSCTAANHRWRLAPA